MQSVGYSDAANGLVNTVMTAPLFELSTPGATVEVTAELRPVSGTNAENISILRVSCDRCPGIRRGLF